MGLIMAILIISIIIYFVTDNLINENSQNVKTPIDRAEDARDEIEEHNQETEDLINEYN